MTETRGGKRKGELTGRHVLYWLAGFFGLMFLANGIFIYFATTTFPGEDVEKSYLQGIDYNRTLEAQAAQAALGWSAQAGLVGEGVAGEAERALVVQFTDVNGRAISGLTVEAELRRRITREGQMVTPLEPVGEGEYASPPLPLCEGLWEIRLRAVDAGGTSFLARKDIINGRSRQAEGDDRPPMCPPGAAGTGESAR